MSAIAAVFNLAEQPVETNLLLKMADRLSHRGDDAVAVLLCEKPVGFVHRMRYTTPQSQTERLPSQSADGQFFITCDARIDNRSELISKLFFNGQKDKEITDSQIILAAYEKWGEDCPQHLIGDFVFAIWDKRNKKLFAARDPLGVKHFYYYYKPRKLFALASEIKALFKIKGVERELNEEHLADYLVVNSEDKENTFFKNIKRLPSTHTLTVSKKDFRVRQYWQPSSEEINFKTDGEYHEAFREKLTEAVECRLRSAYPTGAFLSGGLDSSAIVCLASEHLEKNEQPPLETFSAIFPTVAKTDQHIDERKYMQSVIDKTNCKPHFVTVDDENPLRDMEKICWHADHPVGAPNVYMDLEIYKAAQEKNIRILLSGTDGDSTVGHGYEDFAQLAYRKMYIRLFRDAIALNKNMPRPMHTVKRSVWHRGIKQTVPDSFVKLWRTVRRRKPSDYETSPIQFPLHFNSVKTEIKQNHDLENRLKKLREKNYPSTDSPAESHWRGLTSGHFAFMLEQLEKLSAAYGIEARYPFFDRRLIEFCIALPPGQRIYKGWTRSIFRYAMEGILPSVVQWRTDKSNIGAGIKVNLLKYGFKDIEDAVNLNSSVLEKYIDVELLKSAYQKYKSNPFKSDHEILLLLSNVYLSNWLRQTGFA